MSYTEDIPSEDEIHRIFQKYEVEEYIPQAQNQTTEYPEYKPTPKSWGPKPITIEEYIRRNKGIKQAPTIKKKPHRGGKQRKLRAEKKEILRLMGLTSGEEKRKLYIKLKQL